MLVFILIFFKLNSNIVIENGPSFGAYYPSLNIRLTYEGSPKNKIINKEWLKNLYFASGVFIILKEEKTYKGVFFSSYYKFYKKLPFEHFIKADLGFYEAFKSSHLGLNYNIAYFINNELDFRSSLGISRAYNTNLDFLLGINFKI